MDVKRWRKKAEDRPVWAIILKEALLKLWGPYAEEEEEEDEHDEEEDQEEEDEDEVEVEEEKEEEESDKCRACGY
jgi:hypothetical protein